MKHPRTRLAALILSLSTVAAVLPGIAYASTPVSHAAHTAPDPVGQYQWSLTMAAMQNTQVSGTLTITRKDSTLSATLTSDHTDGELPAKSVTQDGNKVTVVSEGDFGQFTVVIDLSDAEPTGSFKFVSQDGQTDEGPVAIKRVDKK